MATAPGQQFSDWTSVPGLLEGNGGLGSIALAYGLDKSGLAAKMNEWGISKKDTGGFQYKPVAGAAVPSTSSPVPPTPSVYVAPQPQNLPLPQVQDPTQPVMQQPAQPSGMDVLHQGMPGDQTSSWDDKGSGIISTMFKMFGA
jgi:hypothetical protein